MKPLYQKPGSLEMGTKTNK